MDLKVYLATIDMSIKEFSELIDFNRSYVSLVLNGHRQPSRKFSQVVKELTDGQVTVEDFKKKKERQDSKKNQSV